MWGLAARLSPVEAFTFVLLGIFLCLVAVIGFRKWRASRVSPAERERRRRAHLMANGKMGDATLLEVRDTLVFYSYDVRGMEYIASQDVAGLNHSLPSDIDAAGPVMVKYDARNPANSIIIAEEWSGIRKTGAGSHKVH